MFGRRLTNDLQNVPIVFDVALKLAVAMITKDKRFIKFWARDKNRVHMTYFKRLCMNAMLAPRGVTSKTRKTPTADIINLPVLQTVGKATMITTHMLIELLVLKQTGTGKINLIANSPISK